MKKLMGMLWLIGCTGSGAGTAGDPTATPATASVAPKGAAQPVDVVAVVAHPLDTKTHVEGELQAYETVDIRARASGFVARVLVDRGSVVKKGQLLVSITAPELSAQRAESEAKLAADSSTLARLTAAARTPGVVASEELELAASAVDVDKSRLSSLRDLEGYLNVSAPFAGVVTERNVHPGSLVGPQAAATAAPMLHIEQVEQLRLAVSVPEQLVGSVADGAQARFSVRAWPGQTFSGTIHRSSRSIDTRTRTMIVEADVDNADGKLAPGMFADVVWPVQSAGPVLWVPPSAVVQSTDATFVVKIASNRVERVNVERGTSVGELLQVFGALQPGDLVVRRGSEELRPGATISYRVVMPEPAQKPQ